MMRNRIMQYGVLWKQYLVRYRFWIPLMLLVSLSVGMAQQWGNAKEQEYRGLAVGVCVQDEDGETLLGNLEQETGIFTFIGYTQEEEMVRQVQNGSLECGYVLPEGFFQNILVGKTARQITRYDSPASSAQGISFEVVFSALFDMLSTRILEEDYLKDMGFGGTKDNILARERLLALNEEYQKNGSTFHFEYETVEGEITGEPPHLSTSRGIIALMVFLMSLLGLGNCLDLDPVWKAVPGSQGRKLRSGSVHVAIAGSVLLGGGCLLFCGGWQDLFKEIAGLMIYFIALEIYVRVLSLVIRKSSVLYGLLPVLLLGSCLFSPVFIRLETYIPMLSWIAKFFPASYYLNFFLN